MERGMDSWRMVRAGKNRMMGFLEMGEEWIGLGPGIKQ